MIVIDTVGRWDERKVPMLDNALHQNCCGIMRVRVKLVKNVVSEPHSDDNDGVGFDPNK